MTASTLRQLDRTRQPGFARRGASWYAPVEGAQSQAGVTNVRRNEFSSIDGRDSWPTSMSGAVTVSGGSTS
ncbi:MAG TPA: hypothetical protein VF785_23260 [Gemmatimonadaceae bacterium]